jgi:putative ABC transport system substrate-binding protein
MTSRRAFLLILTSSTLAWPSLGEAQQASKIARVGWLWGGVAGPPPPSILEGFREGLRDAGWVEGRNLVIEFRYGPSAGSAEERRNATAQLAKDLVERKVDVIFASPAPAALAAKRVTETVPVVFTGISDPIAFGLVSSLSKPGTNFTGVSFQAADLNPKRLDLLREAAPHVGKIAVLVNRDHPLRERMLKDVQAAVRVTNVTLHVVVTGESDPGELDRAFEAITREGAGAVLGLPVAWYYQHRQRLAELAIRHRLPTVFELGDFADAGCLMGYGPSPREMWRLAATHVDRILKGANPADLPVQQPTKFELVLNVKTAKALGLTIPPSLLLRADRVVE